MLRGNPKRSRKPPYSAESMQSSLTYVRCMARIPSQFRTRSVQLTAEKYRPEPNVRGKERGSRPRPRLRQRHGMRR